jgi:hypothetical protein
LATGFEKWWATSQIAHYIADRPEGPFTLVEVLLKPGQSAQGEWDTGTQHNPTITRIDDRYVLCYHSSISTVERRVRSSERIGMMTAADINGPWKKIGKILDPLTAEESRECSRSMFPEKTVDPYYLTPQKGTYLVTLCGLDECRFSLMSGIN